MLTTLLFALEIRFVSKIESNAWEIQQILYYKKNREALTVLFTVVKHLGSGMNTQEVGETKRCGRVFHPTLLSCFNRFLRALQQNRAQSRLLHFLIVDRA